MSVRDAGDQREQIPALGDVAVCRFILFMDLFINDLILNIPKQGNISSGYAFSLIGISPPPGSPAGALLSCDGFFSLDLGRDASIIISSACHRSSRMRRDVKD